MIKKNYLKPEDVYYLKVNAHVRYWEDSDINGVPDITYEEQKEGMMPRMPLASEDGECWCPVIDVKNLRILDWPKGTEAYIHYKVCDECEVTCLDKNKNPIHEYDYYVPKFLQYADSFMDGDYVVMEIDGEGNLVDFPEDEAEDWISQILEA